VPLVREAVVVGLAFRYSSISLHALSAPFRAVRSICRAHAAIIVLQTPRSEGQETFFFGRILLKSNTYLIGGLLGPHLGAHTLTTSVLSTMLLTHVKAVTQGGIVSHAHYMARQVARGVPYFVCGLCLLLTWNRQPLCRQRKLYPQMPHSCTGILSSIWQKIRRSTKRGKRAPKTVWTLQISFWTSRLVGDMKRKELLST
jgi:hypothetical protein